MKNLEPVEPWMDAQGVTLEDQHPVCEVHGAQHEFVQCDEWGATCVCGENEPV